MSSFRRRLSFAVAFVLCFQVIAPVFLGSTADAVPLPPFNVDGKQGSLASGSAGGLGLNTGVEVAGQSVVVTASGVVTTCNPVGSGCPFSPQGNPNCQGCIAAFGGFQANVGNPWGLIGRIGTSGPWFFIGQGPMTIPSGSGQLHLAVNDNNYADNGGAWTVTVNATPLNQPPVANPDFFNATSGVSLVINHPGVLQNDSNTDGPPPLNAVNASAPTNGTLTLNLDGSFTYTSSPGFTGQATFTYRARDGLGAVSAPATVTIGVAEPLAIVSPASSSLPNGTVNQVYPSVTFPSVTFGASGGTAPYSWGTAPMNMPPATQLPMGMNFTHGVTGGGVLSGTPGQSGSFTLHVEVTDQNQKRAQRVYTFTINAAPANTRPSDVVVTAAPVQLSEGQSTTLSISFSDPDVGQTHVLDIDWGDGTSTHEDSFSGLALTRSHTFVDNGLGLGGQNTVTVVIGDRLSPPASGTVTLLVRNVPPTATVAATPSQTFINTPITINFSDQSDPSSKDTTAGFTYWYSCSPDTDASADCKFTSKGSKTVTVRIADKNGGFSEYPVFIDVVDRAPTVVDDAHGTNEDTALSIEAPGLLGNDSDADGDALTAAFGGLLPTFGTVTVGADGSFVYTPRPNYFGPDSFTYTAFDGEKYTSGTVNIVVRPVNDAPVAFDNSGFTYEDSPLTVDALFGVLFNDGDKENDGLTAVLVDEPANGTVVLAADGSFVYTPDPEFNGNDSFTYQASDGAALSNVATVRIEVRALDDPTQLTADSYGTTEDTAVQIAAPGVLANDTDIDSETLHAEIATQPANGSVHVEKNGSFIYVPARDFHGTDTFTYRVRTWSDAGTQLSEPATVTIKVTPVNDAPTGSADAYETDEDTSLTGVNVLSNDADVDGPLMQAIAVGALPAGLTLAADGAITYDPPQDFNGTVTFSYKVSDGTLSSESITVTIKVLSVNDPPRALDRELATDEDTSVTGYLSAYDADGDRIEFAIAAHPTYGYLDLDRSTGEFTYTPLPNYNGPDFFAFIASDGTMSTTGYVMITVNPVDDAATISIEAPASGAVFAIGSQVTLGGAYSDPDSTSLTASWTITRAGSAVTRPASLTGATVSGTFVPQEAGIYYVTLTGSDGTTSTTATTVGDLPAYFVVYDPSGGSVTGGGWISSPAGAHHGTSPAGRASFGFVSKYLPGRTTPSGSTEFQFKAGSLNFHSDTQDWLLVSGAKARYHGTGTINGRGSYEFEIRVVDGQALGGGGTDRFRIRIWDGRTLVYDNERSRGEDEDATTGLGGGSVQIHKK